MAHYAALSPGGRTKGDTFMKQKTSAPLKLLILVPLFAMVAACGGADDVVAPDPDPTVSGNWSGDAGVGIFDLNLDQQPDGTVTGSGSIVGTTLCLALTVLNGTHVFPNISLTFGTEGVQDLNFTGTVNTPTTIGATLNGSGFDNVNITLEKLINCSTCLATGFGDPRTGRSC